MKKFFWLMATVLISSMTLISCGSDDDDATTPTKTTPNTYEVTVTALLHKCTSEYFYVDVEYTDADGKTNTFTVKAGDQSEAMSEEAQKVYEKAKGFISELLSQCTEEEKAEFDKYTVKNVKITVPEGKSCSFSGTVKVREDYTVTSPETNIITPMVFSTCKYVSGDNPNKAMSGYKGRTSIRAYMGVETDHIDSAIKALNNTNAGSGEITM